MNNWFLFPLSKLETGISNFSFYSRNPRSEFHISLSTLEIRDQNLVFLFLLSKFETRISNFSFYSRNSRSEFQISLSTLEFTFLTLVNAWFGALVITKSRQEKSPWGRKLRVLRGPWEEINFLKELLFVLHQSAQDTLLQFITFTKTS